MPARCRSQVHTERCHCCCEIADRRARARTTSRSHALSSRSSGECPEIPTSARMALAGSRERSQGVCSRPSPGRLSRRCRTH
eukprot:15432737-Alexandrium_andersonii.AAC.1